MKNKQTNVGSFATAKLQVIIAIAMITVIGFSFTACDNGGGDDDNKQPLFSVSGEFKGAGNGNALFKAATTETVSRAAMSADASYELTGELEDGDILFRLRGTFDSSTGSYIASSASSFARYTINGDANGATATLAVKQGDDWISFIVSVTIKEVSVKDGNTQDYAGGLPSWAQGSWHDWYSKTPNDYTEHSFETWAYFDQWYYEASKSSVWHGNWDYTSTKYTVIKAEPLANGVYDVIFSYPFYKATDAQKKTALENFFRDIKVPAEFWNKKFDPWDRDVWNNDWDGKNLNYDNSVIWYICMNKNHPGDLWTKIISWETFVTFFDTQEKQNEVWAAGSEGEWWERKDALEAFFASKNIPNYYYWGWHEADWDPDTPHENRRYTCWEPVCEDGGEGGWWDKTHYYLKWGNQTGIQGDWDRYGDLFSKWTSDEYLVTYLRSQNVEPETWYTRVRVWMEYDTFVFIYYNGDDEAVTSGRYDAPACDTMSLSKIESLNTFDPDTYYGYSNFYQRQRTSPRN